MSDNEAKTQLEQLQSALENDKPEAVRAQLADASPAQIADLLESLPPTQRHAAWNQVSASASGFVLVELNEEVAADLIDRMQPQAVVAAAEGLDIDDLADLIADLPEEIARDVIQSLDEKVQSRLRSVLRFAEDSAGGLMNPDFVSVQQDDTVQDILARLRSGEPIAADTDSLFVVDANARHLGILPLTKLLTSPTQSTAADAMESSVQALRTETSAHEVATFFEQHDLLSAAVVDDDNRLIGRITVDDVVDVIREEADHSMLSMAGLDEHDDVFASVSRSARRRAVWLGVNLATAFAAAWAANLFEATLAQAVMLAVLLPVVPSMGGVAGSQTLILITRGLALGQISRSNARTLLAREFGVAVYNSIGWSALVALVTAWWFETWKIGIVIAGALAANLMCAALAGFFIPLALRRLGVDPALAGGVVLTTVTDVVGIVAFLGLGSVLLL